MGRPLPVRVNQKGRLNVDPTAILIIATIGVALILWFDTEAKP